MLRSAFATLRQPRYAALSALMLLVALACIGAGTWQIARFDGKVDANDDLRGNAHAAPTAVQNVLPLTTQKGPSKDSVQLRTVTATGRYDTAHQALVTGRSVDDKDGFLVLTPFTTRAATLLVVRGFVEQNPDGSAPAVAPPPTGAVSIKARVVTAETGNDSYHAGLVGKINPKQQAARLDTSMYYGYGELLAREPGTSGLTTIPGPSLSNPAGGAVEPQHFAYIIQWYIFALLALAAPFAMARADRRDQEQAGVIEQPRTESELRAARLADRYGRALKP